MGNLAKTGGAALSVEQRVRAVLHAKRQEDPAGELSVSEVCRLAKVNRAGLYAHHQSLLEEIRPRSERTGSAQNRRDVEPSAGTTPTEQLSNQALLYLCLELQLEVRALRALVPSAKAKKK